MLRVKTLLKTSPIQGVGLFAAEDIPAGASIWEFDKGFDLELQPAAVERLNPIARSQVERYAYLDQKRNVYVLCGDNARFMNHADDPNTDDSAERTVASKDIREGDEITCNYRTFDASWKAKI